MTETKELTIKIVGFAMTVFHWWRGELLTRCYLKKKWLARPNTCKKTDQTKLLLRYTCLPPSVLSGQRPWRLSIRHTEKEKAIYFDVSPFFSILILEAVLQITQWRYFPLFPSKLKTTHWTDFQKHFKVVLSDLFHFNGSPCLQLFGKNKTQSNVFYDFRLP